jgi:hypothetical protein
LKKTSASKNPENYRKLPPNILACKETSTIVQTKKLQNQSSWKRQKKYGT